MTWFGAIYLFLLLATAAFFYYWERRYPSPNLIQPVNWHTLLLISLFAGTLWPFWWPTEGYGWIRERNGHRHFCADGSCKWEYVDARGYCSVCSKKVWKEEDNYVI